MARKPIRTQTKAAKNINASMGTILNPMNVLQPPGTPPLGLYTDEDT